MNAPDKAIEIKACFTAVAAFGTALFGWVGWIIIIWIAAIIIDYLTGSAAALKNGEWSSKVARQGLWHKTGSIAAVLVAALLDIVLSIILSAVGEQAMQNGIGTDTLYLALDKLSSNTILTPIVCIWYILTEAGSILENADKLGAPIPDFLRKRLEKLKNNIEDTE